MNDTFLPLGASAAPIAPAVLARRIVSEPRFHHHLTEGVGFWQWVSQRSGDVLKGIAHMLGLHAYPGATADIGTALLIGALAVVAICTARLLRSVVRSPPAQTKITRTPLANNVPDYYAQSLQLAASGEYTNALRLLFHAALLLLDSRGVLRQAPAWTIGECRSNVRGCAPRSTSAFDTLAEPMNDLLYGGGGITPAQWQRARAAYADLAQGAGDES